MTKVRGYEGSYSEKKITRKIKEPTNNDSEKDTTENDVSSSKFIVKFCTGWDEERGAYASVRKSVDTEAEATALIVNVNNFVKEQGGDWSKVKQYLDKDKKGKRFKTCALSKVFSDFLDNRKNNNNLAKRTISTMKTHLKRAYPFFGDKNIREITPNDAENFLHDIRDSKNPLNKGHAASGTYAAKIYITLKKVWEFALDRQYVDTNIFKDKTIEPPRPDTKEKEVLSIGAIEAIMSKLLDNDMDSHEIGLFLLMTTGARLSEMLALRWSEFDEETGNLTIKCSMERDTQELKPTKTKEMRSIPLMPTAQKVLLDWRKRQQNWYKTHGLKWSKNHPICQNKSGTHLLSSNYERWWRENRDRLQVPKFATLHTMRHSFATILIVWCGVDTATVQALTGHAKPDVLLEIYTHSHQQAKVQAMAKLENFLLPYHGEHDCSHCAHWVASPDPADSKGTCWAKVNKTAKIFDGIHVCEINNFELKTVA